MLLQEHSYIRIGGLIVAAFIAGWGAYVAILNAVGISPSELGKKLGKLQLKVDELEKKTPSGKTGKVVNLPKGTILAYYSKDGDVPDGWRICDGTNETPDLSNRFLMGVTSFGEVSDRKDQGKNVYEDNEVVTMGTELKMKHLPNHQMKLELYSSETNVGNYPAYQFYVPKGLPHQRSEEKKHNLTINLGGEGKKHSHGIVKFDNRPEFVSVVFIMKIAD